MRGRKPDGAELQAEKGAPGKRMSQKETQAVRAKREQPISAGNVHPPKWLKKSRVATQIWNEIAPKLQKMNLLSDLDGFPLARYCRYAAEWNAAEEAVRREGTWFEAIDTNGNATKKRHPAFQAMQDLEKIMREIEATFGMRPDARYKILRDQAAAAGLLPLFGGAQVAEENQQADEPTASSETDAVSLLHAFNSVPPAGHA